MYCGVYLFYSFPSEYLFRANGYSGVYAGISFRSVPEPEETQAPEQILLIPLPLAFNITPRNSLISKDTDLVVTLPTIEAISNTNKFLVSKNLSTNTSSYTIPNLSLFNVSYQVAPIASHLYDVADINRITRGVTGTISSFLAADRVFGKVTKSVIGNITGPLVVNAFTVPPVFTVAYAANLVPLSIGSQAIVSNTVRLISERRLRTSVYTTENLNRSSISVSVGVRPNASFVADRLEIPRTTVSQVARTQGLVYSETINIPMTKVEARLVSESAHIYSTIAAPDIQNQLRFSSVLLLSGDTLTTIDLWRY
ncbi:MAG: hypothetical protein KatS3mg087_0094 [Patescibacteria group bacterium]|nr:MAG: hypothetical protein KatS3mg087_0094 [Patescibacteria group bacterium]